jgi:hypothetical protein
MVARKYQRGARKSNPHFRLWRKKAGYVWIACGQNENGTIIQALRRLYQ